MQKSPFLRWGGLFIEIGSILQTQIEEIQTTIKTKVCDSKNILINNQIGFYVAKHPHEIRINKK